MAVRQWNVARPLGDPITFMPGHPTGLYQRVVVAVDDLVVPISALRSTTEQASSGTASDTTAPTFSSTPAIHILLVPRFEGLCVGERFEYVNSIADGVLSELRSVSM